MFHDHADPRWRGLFAAAAVGAILTALCVPLQVIVFIAFPPPTGQSPAAWLDLFATNPVLGLVSLDFLMMVEQVLMIPVVLALWLLVHRASESAALLGAAVWLGGGLLLLGSNTGFEMLALARGHAVAPEAGHAVYVAAAQGMLASYWDMGTSFVFGYVLTSTGGILVGLAMARAALFGRLAGRVLVVANVVGLGIFLPGVGVVLALGSVVILWAWFLRAGWGFARLVRGAAADPVGAPAPTPAVAPAPVATTSAG
jgi:hypothetical protein